MKILGFLKDLAVCLLLLAITAGFVYLVTQIAPFTGLENYKG